MPSSGWYKGLNYRVQSSFWAEVRDVTTHTQNPTPKWATFTYIGKETTFITNLFKKFNMKIAFRTNNTIQKLLIHKQHQTDIHSQSGVYKLTCPDCGKAYVGQTGILFHHTLQRTQERLQDRKLII
jgi:predicted methyltransferase